MKKSDDRERREKTKERSTKETEGEDDERERRRGRKKRAKKEDNERERKREDEGEREGKGEGDGEQPQSQYSERGANALVSLSSSGFFTIFITSFSLLPPSSVGAVTNNPPRPLVTTLSSMPLTALRGHLMMGSPKMCSVSGAFLLFSSSCMRACPSGVIGTFTVM